MRGTWQGSGTWQTSGGGLGIPPDLLAVIAAVGAGAFAMEWLLARVWWLVAATAAAGAIAGTGWLITLPRRAARRAEVTAGWAATRSAIEERNHARRLEIARASAPQISIDPAAIAAALVTQPRLAWPQDPARVVRGEVER